MHLPYSNSLLLITSLLCGFTTQAAVQVNWTLPGPDFSLDHELSDGSALPAGYRFQIGIFQNSFVPTLANIDDWSDNWRGLAIAEFDGGLGIFNTFSSESSLPNFPTAQPLYVYGYQPIDATHAEVFLATDPSWTIPANSPLATPTIVDINLATDVILGSINSSDNIQTAKVTLNEWPPIFYSEWILEYFSTAELADPLTSGATADADGDGLSNGLEYLSNLEPTIWSASPLSLSPASGGNLLLSTNLNANARGSWTLRRSLDLDSWSDATEQPLANPLRDALELLVTPSIAREFWRIRFDAVDP